MTEWYDFPTLSLLKMLSFFSVVEAYGLIYPRPSCENSSFACLPRKKAKTEWYDFSNVKSSKMLSFDSVAEAYGLINPRPFGKNFKFFSQVGILQIEPLISFCCP